MAAAAVAMALTAVLSGCVATPVVVAGSAVSVGLSQPFSSLNASTTFGDSAGNAAIEYATGSGFSYLDETGNPVVDASFGSYELVSSDPLVVRYTVADGVQWSDGTPVDAADLMLAWAAGSGVFNAEDVDLAAITDPATGRFTAEVPADLVYFDSGADPSNPAGLALVQDVPEVSADRVSVTLTFDEPVVDWETAFLPLSTPPLPAHVVARHALGIDDPQEAKAALVSAIVDDDTAALAKISQFWSTGFNLAEMPAGADADVLVSSGPYRVTGFVPRQYVTLEANPLYSGSRSPVIQKVTVRFIADPLVATQALFAGEVDVISPQATVEVIDALGRLGVTVVSGFENTFEHVDLRFADSKSGLFADPRVREAFLKTVPRAEIVDALVSPVQEDATTRDSWVFRPGSPEYEDAVAGNGSQQFAAVDIEGARALLQEAGVSDPPVCVLYDPADSRRAAEFALIAESARSAGFAVEDCGAADWQAALGTAGRYDAAIVGSEAAGTGFTVDPAAYTTDGPRNVSGYSNPEVDELLSQLPGETDRAARAEVLTQLDGLLWADFSGVPLFQYPAVTAFDQSAVRGIIPVAFSPGVFWNVWDWTPVSAAG